MTRGQSSARYGDVMAGRTYFDAGGAAPLTPRVAQALEAGFAQGWADPARLAAEGRQARAILDGAREAIADAVGITAETVHFTSSPHAAFERLLAGIAAARRGRGRIVISAVERDALVHAAEYAASEVDVVPVDRHGHIDMEALRAALDVPDVALLAVQHANQELGTVQRISAVAHLAEAAGVPFVVDATSSIGHINPPPAWDALIAHPADWGGPAGIGVMALRPRTRWLPQWPEAASGADEWAPGGVAVPLALASAVALQERMETLTRTGERLGKYVNDIRAAVSGMEGIDVQGDSVERLPHVLTFSCLYADGEALLNRLDREGFSIGSGSACASGTLEPSRVLAAVGALTHGNVRLALHPGVTRADVDRFLDVLPGIVDELRVQAGVRPT